MKWKIQIFYHLYYNFMTYVNLFYLTLQCCLGQNNNNNTARYDNIEIIIYAINDHSQNR